MGVIICSVHDCDYNSNNPDRPEVKERSGELGQGGCLLVQKHGRGIKLEKIGKDKKGRHPLRFFTCVTCGLIMMRHAPKMKYCPKHAYQAKLERQRVK